MLPTLFCVCWRRYSVFQDRPMLADIVAYCCIDVAYFELLEAVLYAPLPATSRAWVTRLSDERVRVCLKSVSSNSGGREKCIAPKGP